MGVQTKNKVWQSINSTFPKLIVDQVTENQLAEGKICENTVVFKYNATSIYRIY